MERANQLQAVTRYIAADGVEYKTKAEALRANRRGVFHNAITKTGGAIGSWEEAAKWIEENADVVRKFIGPATEER